jgi:AbrB family looped-hinge helix DNA binding protein
MGSAEMKKTYTIQENGQVTLPAEWREKYGLKKGDVVVFEEIEQGLLVSPRVVLAMKLLDEIGEELKAKGVTLEELMERGRQIRGEILKEEYGIDAGDDD